MGEKGKDWVEDRRGDGPQGSREEAEARLQRELHVAAPGRRLLRPPPGEQVRVLVLLDPDMGGDPGEVHLKKGPQGHELPPHSVCKVFVCFGDPTLV